MKSFLAKGLEYNLNKYGLTGKGEVYITNSVLPPQPPKECLAMYRLIEQVDYWISNDEHAIAASICRLVAAKANALAEMEAKLADNQNASEDSKNIIHGNNQTQP